jgi:hypothetical protein
MFSKRSIKEKSHLPNKSQMLTFLVGLPGIFSFLSDAPLIDLLELLEVKSSDQRDWFAFRLVCSKDGDYFKPNEVIQFHFKSVEIQIESYEIKTEFKKWRLLSSLDSVNWIPQHSVDENENFNSHIFRVQSFAPISFLRIKNEGEC